MHFQVNLACPISSENPCDFPTSITWVLSPGGGAGTRGEEPTPDPVSALLPQPCPQPAGLTPRRSGAQMPSRAL